ncbi:hypothetical protein VFPPC_14142 [Pochonia chlamydosporia 170]|uniref:Rhodopsin domain-containing protein n=1 Tax=Pochonia chlamydosporia 170 TaxID=1380566 RepID=A0A179FA79_METCM|nr:hypothetical protein VFPPC_14142 [Pochonia chlamydosporia 170]OAQ62362.2 hypothetical protein VFPPC_14142 [Pochonia chlamydosporia 170]
MFLPLPYIWKMTIPWEQKVAITGTFMLGLLVTIVSAMRFVVVYNLDLTDPDITWNQGYETMWTGVEVNIATVCACLLSFKPLLNLLIFGTIHPVSRPSSAAGIDTIGGSAEAARRRNRVLRRGQLLREPGPLEKHYSIMIMA